MPKDKVEIIFKDWKEIQQSRIDKMRLRVRVKIAVEQYYADLKFTTDEIIIKPVDHEKNIVALCENRIRGFNEIEPHGIQLTQRFGKPNYEIYFRTASQRNRALKRIKVFVGCESTPSAIGTSE